MSPNIPLPFDRATSSALMLPAAGALGALVLYSVYNVFLTRTPLDDIPGPDPAAKSWLWGWFPELQEDHDAALQKRWFADYGHVFVHRALFGQRQVVTTDLRAIQHILAHADTFQKSLFVRRFLGRVFGWGVLVAEGAPHRAQRRVLNPAFGPAQIRELSGVFLDKANELRDLWLSKLDPAMHTVRLNAFAGLSAATLDIIGLAGFGYAFDALARPEDNPEELGAAFAETIRAESAFTVALNGSVPGAQYLPTGTQRQRREMRTMMDRIGRSLVNERKAAVATTGKADAGGRDLLSLLVRANLSEDAAHRLSDDEVLAQIPTFILAGHESPSTAISWTLFELAQNVEIQSQLRAELRTLPLPTAATNNAPLDADTLAALDKMPLLDAVVRESLRVYAPVQNVGRMATEDAAIPLDRPFLSRHGRMQDQIRLKKGDLITVPVGAVHRNPEIWGADADAWKPERWLVGVPEETKAVPGVWGHLLTFIGGPHACIGFRFSLLETKILLHALVAGLRFELGVPAAEIGRRAGAVMRPVLENSRAKGIHLPLHVMGA